LVTPGFGGAVGGGAHVRAVRTLAAANWSDAPDAIGVTDMVSCAGMHPVMFYALASVVALCILAVFVLVFARGWKERAWLLTAQQEFAAVVGLPMAAAAALFVVVLFKDYAQSAEPIKVEGLGFRFEGAAGPVILWILCFLAITGAVKMVWRGTPRTPGNPS
jgi:hypothetical protein